MVNRKRDQLDEPPAAETVTTEPVLVPPIEFCPKLKVETFRAVDYLGTRFRIGDHVAMYNSVGKEWVCVLETLYRDPETSEAKFKGRWFWSVDDVLAHREDLVKVMRPSKCTSHELISSDNRDTNLIESISRKCHVLSYENFQLVKKVVTKPNGHLKKTYYCDRQFYHKANRFSELNSVLFPGDPIPQQLRVAAGLPELPPVSLDDDDFENAYMEPGYSTSTRSNRMTKAKNGSAKDSPQGDPVLLW